MTIQRRYIEVNVTTPINTAQATPQSTPSGITNVVLNAVEVLIPPGHQGLTGVSVQWNGVGLVPFGQPPSFIVGDDYVKTFDVGEQIGGQLVVVTFNTDTVFSHTHFLRFDVTPFVLTTPATLAAVPQLVIA